MNISSHKGIYYPTEVQHSSAVVKSLLSGRTWEKNIVNIFKQHVKSGDVVVDAGAFIGLHSFQLSKLVGDSGKVYSFEAIPPVYRCLVQSIEELEMNNIRPKNIALYDKKNETLEFLSDLDGKSSVSCYRRRPFKYRYEIKTTTLDDFFFDRGIQKCNFIKIDVEGSEWKVMEGAEGIINTYRPKIVIETWGTKKNTEALLKFCTEKSYIMTKLTCDNYLLLPVQNIEKL